MITTYILVLVIKAGGNGTTATMAVDGYRTQSGCQAAADIAIKQSTTWNAYCIPQQREVQSP